MAQAPKPTEKSKADQEDIHRKSTEAGARAKPMREKDREDWEDKKKSKPLRVQR